MAIMNLNFIIQTWRIVHDKFSAMSAVDQSTENTRPSTSVMSTM